VVKAAYLFFGDGGIFLAAYDAIIEDWMAKQIAEETNPRRREFLKKGLGHGTLEFLRCACDG
jgi:hypothetical protein